MDAVRMTFPAVGTLRIRPEPGEFEITEDVYQALVVAANRRTMRDPVRVHPVVAGECFARGFLEQVPCAFKECPVANLHDHGIITPAGRSAIEWFRDTKLSGRRK